MSGKNKHHNAEKEEKKDKVGNHSQIDIVIDDNRRAQAAETKKEERADEIKESSPWKKLSLSSKKRLVSPRNIMINGSACRRSSKTIRNESKRKKPIR